MASRSRPGAATSCASPPSTPSRRSSSGWTLEEIAGRLRRRSGALLVGDGQLRWVGPEKGVIHLATAAVVNADLGPAREAGGQAAVEAPRRHVARGARRARRLPLHHRRPDAGRGARAARGPRSRARRARGRDAARDGYPAYTTSAGWLGYPDDKVRAAVPRGRRRRLGRTSSSRSALDLEDDARRCAIVREEIGAGRCADGRREPGMGRRPGDRVDGARSRRSARGGSRSRRAPTTCSGTPRSRARSRPIGVATGEHATNRVDVQAAPAAGRDRLLPGRRCRLGGVNEVLAVLLLAAKFGVPVCPHAGGVGLCEYVQHLAVFDYIAVSGSLRGPRRGVRRPPARALRRPLVVVDGRYLVPTVPGYSSRCAASSIVEYAFPHGRVWDGGVRLAEPG